MDTSALFPLLTALISAITSLVKLMWAQFHAAHPDVPEDTAA